MKAPSGVKALQSSGIKLPRLCDGSMTSECVHRCEPTAAGGKISCWGREEDEQPFAQERAEGVIHLGASHEKLCGHHQHAYYTPFSDYQMRAPRGAICLCQPFYRHSPVNNLLEANRQGPGSTDATSRGFSGTCRQYGTKTHVNLRAAASSPLPPISIGR